MRERIPTSTEEKCPRTECGSDDVNVIGGVDAGHIPYPREDSPVERTWICNTCKKPFRFVPCRYCTSGGPQAGNVCSACAEVEPIIRHKLQNGGLLSCNGFAEYSHSNVRHGSASSCSACDKLIEGKMLIFSTARRERVFHVHPRCHQVWDGLGNSDQPWRSDPREPKGK